MMLNAIEKDYRGTGKCLLALAREPDYSFSMMVDFEKTESHVQKFHRSVLRSDSRLRSFFRRVYWRKNQNRIRELMLYKIQFNELNV